MQRTQFISAVVFSVATGLASSAALAHDGDTQTTASHNADLALASQVVERSTSADFRTQPLQRDVTSVRANQIANPFTLNVPGNPAFGRIASQ